MFGDLSQNTKSYPVKKLSDIADYWNGLTYKPADTVESGAGTLVLRSSNIQNGELAFDDNVFVSCTIKEKLYVQDNDILMCSRNGSAALVGKTALIKGLKEPTTFGAFMMIIRSKYYPYLKTYFELPFFRNQISTGTSTINQITGKMLNDIQLPVPDTDTVSEFENFVHQSDKSKFTGFKSQFIEMFGDPVRNDKEWPTKPIKEVAPETNADIPKDNEYWWLNLDMIESYSGRLLDRVIEKSDAIGSSTHPFDDSMVLYSKLRPYLNKIFVPDSYGYATTELVALKPNPNELNKYFLFNLLRGDCFVNFANKSSSGAQMPRMQMKVLREFQCILPPMDLQNKFVEISEQADKSK